ncbi:MAG: hypothetical protein SGJ09_17645 [Phycisphaerae bacterium]|nr:hypothetical protein [Phycisphaerae bacterium]
MTNDRPDLSSAFRWALDAASRPGRAATDWLAAEIVPGSTSAAAAISATSTTIEQLIALKVAFKALRQGGGTAAERNRAARLYAATIAAAMVRFGVRITRNSDSALSAAFIALRDDDDMEEPLRDLGAAALPRLNH